MGIETGVFGRVDKRCFFSVDTHDRVRNQETGYMRKLVFSREDLAMINLIGNLVSHAGRDVA